MNVIDGYITRIWKFSPIKSDIFFGGGGVKHIIWILHGHEQPITGLE